MSTLHSAAHKAKLHNIPSDVGAEDRAMLSLIASLSCDLERTLRILYVVAKPGSD